MTKPLPLMISAILGGLVAFFLMRSKSPETASIKEEKKELVKGEKELMNLAVKDTSITRQIAHLETLVRAKDKEVAFWKSRYTAPIEVSKLDEFTVMSEDSVTITRQVIKGSICDSLQRVQGQDITGLKQEVAALDSSLLIKTKSIHTLEKMDSVHYRIESKLIKKVRIRTLEAIGLGLIAVLAIVGR